MNTINDILRTLRDEAQYADLDLDSAYRSEWWHRPFTAAELDQHPDRERILATIKAAVDDVLERTCVTVAGIFEDDKS